MSPGDEEELADYVVRKFTVQMVISKLSLQVLV